MKTKILREDLLALPSQDVIEKVNNGILGISEKYPVCVTFYLFDGKNPKNHETVKTYDFIPSTRHYRLSLMDKNGFDDMQPLIEAAEWALGIDGLGYLPSMGSVKANAASMHGDYNASVIEYEKMKVLQSYARELLSDNNVSADEFVSNLCNAGIPETVVANADGKQAVMKAIDKYIESKASIHPLYVTNIESSSSDARSRFSIRTPSTHGKKPVMPTELRCEYMEHVGHADSSAEPRFEIPEGFKFGKVLWTLRDPAIVGLPEGSDVRSGMDRYGPRIVLSAGISVQVSDTPINNIPGIPPYAADIWHVDGFEDDEFAEGIKKVFLDAHLPMSQEARKLIE